MATNTVGRFDRAIVRKPGHSVVHGLRATDRGNPTYDEVCQEHQAYVDALHAAGVSLTVLPELEEFPDSVFVEDPALVFSQGAVLLRPGAPSRAGEVDHLRVELERQFDRVLAVSDTGTADGGDILMTRDQVLIGLSARTDRLGAESLGNCLNQLGIKSRVVATPEGVLHFKSDCSLLDDEAVLGTARLAASGVFSGLRVVVVPEGEEAAANALRVNDVVLVGSEFSRTHDLLDRQGYNIFALPTQAIGKIDAGLSCMSLRWLAA